MGIVFTHEMLESHFSAANNSSGGCTGCVLVNSVDAIAPGM